MRTLKSLLYVTAFATGFLMSCNDDDNNSDECFGSNPVSFTSEISTGEAATRASGKQWGTDAIGVYMKKAGEALSEASIVNDAKNNKFTTIGDGKFTHATPDEAIYFPQNGSKVDFIAYYPYDADLNTLVYPVDVSDQSNPEAIDLLYSANLADVDKGSATANLQFDHMLTNLVINVKDETAQGLTGLTVTFGPMITQADFSLVDGTFSQTPAFSARNISALVNVNGSNATASVIVLPVTTDGVSVLFQVGDRSYLWEIPDGTVFDSKNRYTFDINLKSNGNIVVLNPGGSITDWIGNNGGTIDLGDDGDNEGDGTLSNPYTVDQISAKVGENAKWIEGYIVGSTTTLARVVGTPSTENILIAATADETSEANCIPVDIASSTVKENLDIVANPELIGKKIKIQGDIVNDIFGGIVSLTNITAQEGGATVTPGPGGDTLEFLETFGPTWRGEGQTGTLTAKWDNFIAMDQFDMKAPIVYSTGSDAVDFRCTNGYDNPHIWFAKGYDKSFKIEGIEAGYSNMTLTYDLAGNQANMAYDGMKVKCNGNDVTIPTETLGTGNTFSTVTFSIPDGTTTIEFYTTPAGADGYRLDNIKITGTK